MRTTTSLSAGIVTSTLIALGFATPAEANHNLSQLASSLYYDVESVHREIDRHCGHGPSERRLAREGEELHDLAHHFLHNLRHASTHIGLRRVCRDLRDLDQVACAMQERVKHLLHDVAHAHPAHTPYAAAYPHPGSRVQFRFGHVSVYGRTPVVRHRVVVDPHRAALERLQYKLDNIRRTACALQEILHH